VKRHYGETSPDLKTQYIKLKIFVGHSSVSVLTLLKNVELSLVLIDASEDPEDMPFQRYSVGNVERTVDSITRKIL
jgi:hypothetical protein